MRVRSLVLTVALSALTASGCGSSPRDVAPSASAVHRALAHSPAPLAALHSQADQLLGGGASAFKRRLAALRGYPVVVNMWASWCVPCQSEFPFYQRVAVMFGKRVAFVGIDAKDHNGAAGAFLERFPVSYPSYVDPDGSIAAAIRAISAYPQTFYIDRQGKMVYDKAGPYLSAAELERDIRHYALG